ncbi:MAG: hypothetical protein ABI318_00385 [Chthoniobacteraceae bacterium]
MKTIILALLLTIATTVAGEGEWLIEGKFISYNRDKKYSNVSCTRSKSFGIKRATGQVMILDLPDADKLLPTTQVHIWAVPLDPTQPSSVFKFIRNK